MGAGFKPLDRGDATEDGDAPHEPARPPYEHAVLSEHERTVYAVAYSPDGLHFATADTEGKRTLLWDATTKMQVGEFKKEGHGRVYGVAFSADSKLLATSDFDNKLAYTWDVQTQQMRQTFKGHNAGVWPVAFSPDSKKLLTGSWDCTAKIWDASTGKLESTLKGHLARLMGVAWCPDGHQVATASFDSQVRTWEAETGDPLHVYHTNEAGEGLACVQYSPDGTMLIAGGDNGGATLFSVHNGKERRHKMGKLIQVLEHRTNPVNQFGKEINSGKSGNILTLENDKNKMLRPKVAALAFSADGRRVACAYSDSQVRIWDLALCEVVQQLRGHTTGPVWSLAFAPSGTEIVTGGADKSARVWDTVRHGDFSALFKGHTNSVTAIACAPDGKSFVSSSFDNSVRVWRVGADLSPELMKHEFQAPLTGAHYSPDGKLYAVGGYNHDPDGSFLVTIYDAHTHAETTPIKVDAKIQSLKFSPDSTRLAIALEDRSARIWTVGPTPQEIHKLGPNPGHTGIVTSIDWHPDGTAVVTGSWDNTAIVWDLSSDR